MGVMGYRPDTSRIVRDEPVHGAKELINRLSKAGTTENFAAEREITFEVIGSPKLAGSDHS